jgi:long-chain acyl-CoA synthetase
MAIKTIVDHFKRWETDLADQIFLQQRSATGWTHFSWKQAGTEARQFLSALQRANIQRGDRVAILSQNCAYWIISDLAILMGGFISVPLYANVNPKAMLDILHHSDAKVLVLGKLADHDWNQLKGFIPRGLLCITMRGYERDGFTSWDEFINGQEASSEIPPPQLSDIMTIIYTSGTTGNSKGVVHTHESIMNALNIAAREVQFQRQGNRFFSYLPLSHAAERGLVEFGAIYCGGSIGFAHSIEDFSESVKHVSPTHFLGVPRIWEKFQSKILESIPQKRLSLLLKIPLIRTVVQKKIRQSLGLKSAVVILTGAAPITPDLLIWFQKLNIRIREAYGMSENFNVCSINPEGDIRPGSVGKLFPEQEIVIDPDTQEITQRSSWLMQGYYKDPELTSQTIVHGFLHTGDMGKLSSDGYLTITGRVKDIFKTRKGEYIAPAPIEKIFQALDVIDQACVMGSHYHQPFIILVLSGFGKREPKSAIQRILETTLQDYNKDCMEYQRLKKAIILKEEWTPDNGLLTPSLKMKRNVLSEKYEVTFGKIYESEEEVSWE